MKLTNAANTFAANNITVEAGTLQYAFGAGLSFPAAVKFNVQQDATLQFNDGFSTTINGAVVNNGSIVKPAGLTSQLVFKGGAITGSGILLGQDVQTNNSGPPNFIQATTAEILAHAFLFDNGQTNTIGGMEGFDPASSTEILAVNGPNTSVHITGNWDGDGATQTSWLVVNNGAKVFIDTTASLDTSNDVGGLRPFAGRGDGTGVVEFADGFVANKHDEAPGVNEFYVWSPGNFRWITHSDTNFPDSNIEINQEDGGVWSVQSRAQTLLAGLTTSRSFTIETQTDLTLGRAAAFHSFDGTKTVTKTGAGTLTVAGEWSVGSGAGVRIQDSSLGTTFQINASKFVTLTDMGQAATGAGANGVFGSPGQPDADDVVSTSFIYKVVLSNAGTSADFDASQHIQSLKINSGAAASLNTFTYGNGAATSLQTDLLGVDAGAGTLNIGAGNLVTVRSGTGSFKLAAATSLKVQGGGTLNINGTQTHGVGALLNIAAGTLNLATDGGTNLTISDLGITTFLAAQHLKALTVGAGGVANVLGGDVNVSGAASTSGTLNLAVGGTTAGSLYYRLRATGQLTLAGTLAISLTNQGTFVSVAGNTFDILDWGSLSAGSAFSSLVLPGGGLTWDTSQLYTSGILTVGGLLGDYNHDGIVDAPDYVVWRSSLGQVGTSLAADGNDNGLIDSGDFAVWSANFGKVLIGGGAGSNAAIPEPTSWLLMCLGAACLLGRRLLATTTVVRV